MAAEAVVCADSLSLRIGKRLILDNVSFTLEKGGIYGLVGHNGAGKSTLMRTILGLEPDFSGRLSLFGSDRLSEGRRKTGAMLPGDKLPPKITGERYLKELCLLVGCDPAAETERVSKLSGSSEFLKDRIQSYSYGMKQRLSLAGALTGSPELVFLDEAFKGLDPEAAGQLQMTIAQLRREGVTIVITDHYLKFLIDLECEFLVMNGGRLTHRLTCRQLDTDPLRVKRFTLGAVGMTNETFAASFPEYCGIARGGVVDVIIPGGKDVPNDLIRDCVSVTEADADREEMLIWYISGKDER